MQSAEDDASSQAVTPDHDLYTLPHYSSWFSWDEIHETETTALHEFFDGSSISRTPKIYKEYRDFIINKYREDPSRKLAFTDIRKFLIGDVSSLHKVFIFLENWGLINYSASSNHDDVNLHDSSAVVLEEAPPNGIRVVAYPNSSKPLFGRNMVPDGSEFDGGDESGRLRLPPLTSYSDVFGDIPWENGLICGSCGEECVSGYYESAKESFLICVKCFKNENFKGTYISDDFKFHDHVDDSVGRGTDAWTDTENMLLLEAVLKHGGDWNLVADHVKTKSKLECVARLIQLPCGEYMLASLDGKGDNRNSRKHMSNISSTEATSVDVQAPIKTEDQNHEDICETEQTERGNIPGLPSNSRCITSFADGGTSLMKQVALWSTVAGPPIAAAAAEAAVTALCNENPYAKNILDVEEDNGTSKFESPSHDEVERVAKVDDSEIEERRKPSETTVTTTEKNSGPSTLQIRAEIATALGAAAAHAKLLADQEDREIEHLLATIIDTQMKKINYKIKHFEELELIMEKEFCQIQQLKESILADRIDVLQRALKAGISRWKEHTFGKPLVGSIQ